MGLAGEAERKSDFRPFALDTWWGAPWDTTWFRFSGVAPAVPTDENPLDSAEARQTNAGQAPGANGRQEVVIDFGWQDHSVGFQCEGLVYRPDGTIVKALNPKNRWIPLELISSPGEPFVFYVEAASNPLLLGVPPFQPIEHSAKPEVYEGALYQLRQAEICYYNAQVAALAADLEALSGIAEVIPEESARYEQALMGIDRALNVLDTRDVPGTAAAARKELVPGLALQANASAHQVSAMGHAHIDSAWLWPLRETERKAARTVSNVLNLLEEHEDFIFTMSSAQQYFWLEQRYPNCSRD